MKYRHLFAWIIPVLALVFQNGCKKEPETGEPLKFKVMGVRGINDFPENMEFGLFADSPVGTDNAPFRVMGNYQTLFNNNVSLNWGFNQANPSRLLVYAPYNPDYDGFGESEMDVPLDQSTEENFLHANFLLGQTSGRPGQSNVVVRMEHAMTAMMLMFDNRTGDRVDSCFVSGFMTHGVFNKVTGTLKAASKNAVVIPFRSPWGDDVFCFQYLPQEGTPTVYVQFESGKIIAMTFSSYFQYYPGKVVSPGLITLTEDMGPYNILPLDGVSVMDWSNNIFPSFPKMNQTYNLNTLAQVNTDSTDNGYFSANISKVYVTAVDANSTNAMGFVLEDSTRAIYAWLDYDRRVRVGESYVGLIDGRMEKTAGDYRIVELNLDNATRNVERNLPCSAGDFAALARNGVGNMEYRRTLFENVKVVEPFENGMAVFSQNGVELPVVVSGGISPSAGSYGNIIGFPVTVGGKTAVRIFDVKQLDSLKKDYESDVFTRTVRPGLYSLTDTAMLVWDYPETCQISTRSQTKDRSLQISDFSGGRYVFFYVYAQNEAIRVGHEYTVAVHEWDMASDHGTTVTMECVRVEDDKVWLRDRAGQNGLVMTL